MKDRSEHGAAPIGLSTYSIVGADPEANECGVAVQSKFLGVGAFVPWARGGVAAVAVQAYPDITHGNQALDLLSAGQSPQETLDQLLSTDDLRQSRQLGIVAANGESASFTGSDCFEHAGGVTGHGFAAQGNILSSEDVPSAMADTFVSTEGNLGHRLLKALEAGEEAGGERRGMESAALLVVKPSGGYGGNHDRWLDLRVDHADQPIEELGHLFDLHNLYFGKSSREELLDLDENLENEVENILKSLDWWDEDRDFSQNLFSWMGWHNLEERQVEPGVLDPLVLRELRNAQTGE